MGSGGVCPGGLNPESVESLLRSPAAAASQGHWAAGLYMPQPLHPTEVLGPEAPPPSDVTVFLMRGCFTMTTLHPAPPSAAAFCFFLLFFSPSLFSFFLAAPQRRRRRRRSSSVSRRSPLKLKLPAGTLCTSLHRLDVVGVNGWCLGG